MGTYSIYKIQLLSPCLNSCFAISETISSSVRFYLRPLLVLDSQYLSFIIAHVKDHFNLSAFSPISLSSSVTTWFECKMSPTDLWVNKSWPLSDDDFWQGCETFSRLIFHLRKGDTEETFWEVVDWFHFLFIILSGCVYSMTRCIPLLFPCFIHNDGFCPLGP